MILSGITVKCCVLTLGLAALTACTTRKITLEQCQGILDSWSKNHPGQARMILSKYEEKILRLWDRNNSAADDRARTETFEKLVSVYVDINREAFSASGAPGRCPELAAEALRQGLKESGSDLPALETGE